MTVKDTLLAQLEREADGTRKALANVPEGRNDWKPHPKSMPLGSLANLVASMPAWAALIVDADELDLSKPFPQSIPTTNKELLQVHEQSLAAGRKALSSTTDEHLMKPWTLRLGDKVVDKRPRHLIIEDTIAHLAHHRGQLTVYLRLNDAPVPAIYGASADSGW